MSDCQLPQKMNDINEIERGEEGKKGGIDFKRQALRTTYKCLLCPKGAPALRQGKDHRLAQALPKEMVRRKVRTNAREAV